MALKPTKPDAPDPALRSLGKDIFNARAESNVSYFETMTNYNDEIATYVDERADDVAINAVLPTATVWATATAYVVNDVVEESGLYYVCKIAHTSGVFATDLAAVRWELIGAERFDINANTLILTTGSANAYILAAQETITSYATGQLFRIQINHTNTSAATINVDGVGVKDIQQLNDAGTPTALGANTLTLGEIHEIGYDGTRFILHSQPISEITDQIGMVPLATRTASASTELDFTEFDDTKYEGYVFKAKNLIPSSNQSIFCRVSTDAGSSFISTANYEWSYSYRNLSGTATLTEGGATADTEVAFGPSVASAGAGCNLTLELHNAGETSPTAMDWSAIQESDSGGLNWERSTGAGVYTPSAAVDALRFAPFGGNFTSGKIIMYGIRKV